jgi:hypothetical protein
MPRVRIASVSVRTAGVSSVITATTRWRSATIPSTGPAEAVPEIVEQLADFGRLRVAGARFRRAAPDQQPHADRPALHPTARLPGFQSPPDAGPLP